MSDYFMGIDLGGTVTKAGIYTASGQEIQVVSQALPLISSNIGFCERDMDELWLATCQVIRQVLVESGIDAGLISGVSFSSHGKGLYLLDKKGNPIRYGIVSSDNRAQELVSRWKQQGKEKQAYPYSYQQLWPSHPVALLGWLKQYEADSYSRIRHILMVHDFIRYRLSGELACEATNISGSNLFNQKTGAFDADLFGIFDLPEMMDKIPIIRQSADIAGYITPQAACLCGLKAGTPVFCGMFDVVAAALTSGVHNSSQLSAVAGTWSIASRVFNAITPDDYPYVWGKYSIPGTCFAHEGSPTSASNLNWFLKQCLPSLTCHYQQLDHWVATCYEKPTSILFFPWLYGSNFHENVQAGFLGLAGQHHIEDMIYAIYQGIVFSHLLHQDRILQLPGQTTSIRFTGGPTQSRIWMQMFCDASNLPLEIVNIEQSGCRAAAMCAAVGVGEFQDFSQAMQAATIPLTRLEPNIDKHHLLRQRFERFKQIATALSSV